ncbi:hypothetical protein D3C72_373550 [compost metagenome]
MRPAAPVNSLLLMDRTPWFHELAALRRGVWPSRRSSSSMPMVMPEPRPSKLRVQGESPRALPAWIGPLKAPLAPGRIREMSVIAASPRKLRPPVMLRPPDPVRVRAWPRPSIFFST